MPSRSARVGVLPEVLRPFRCDDLVRLGRDGDGGYLARESDVRRSEGLLSFGVGNDWSFEEAFADLAGCGVDAYDGSVDEAEFRRLFFRSLLRPWRGRPLRARWRVWRGYRRFFRGAHRHVHRFVGVADRPSFASLDEALAGAPPGPLFLKADIEGHEYRLLDGLIAQTPRLTGLVVEFHFCDLLMPRIVEFVEAFDLRLVHTHVNNSSQLGDGGVPSLLELTFSSGEVRGERVADGELPHHLDMCNDQWRDDIVPRFAPPSALQIAPHVVPIPTPPQGTS